MIENLFVFYMLPAWYGKENNLVIYNLRIFIILFNFWLIIPFLLLSYAAIISRRWHVYLTLVIIHKQAQNLYSTLASLMTTNTIFVILLQPYNTIIKQQLTNRPIGVYWQEIMLIMVLVLVTDHCWIMYLSAYTIHWTNLETDIY